MDDKMNSLEATPSLDKSQKPLSVWSAPKLTSLVYKATEGGAKKGS